MIGAGPRVIFGFVGAPTQSTYCATKFAVRGFSEALWTELRGSAIGVTSIHPGGVRTGIAKKMRSYDDAVRDAAVSGIDQSRPPERVAEAIVRGIEGKKLRVIVGGEAHLTERLKRLFPVGFHRLVARLMPDEFRAQG